jgi:hypothetical protein
MNVIRFGFFVAIPWRLGVSIPLQYRPFATVTSPQHFECISTPTQISIDLVIPDALGVVGSPELLSYLSNSSVCLEVHSGTTLAPPANCVPLTSSLSSLFPGQLGQGCHTLLVYWLSSGGFERGSAHHVLIRVAPNNTEECAKTCTRVEVTAPNYLTGGCVGACCTEGCCEFINMASRCNEFSDGLPSCSSCMKSTAPSYNVLSSERTSALLVSSALPEPARSTTAAYVELVKRTVLNTVFEPAPEKVDGHVWPEGDSPTLSMVSSSPKR